jgi:hypothetical protein
VVDAIIDGVCPVRLEERVEAIAVGQVYLSGADRSYTGRISVYVEILS